MSTMETPPTVKAELVATDLAAVETACAAGADRIELCAALGVGGVTPGAGLLAEAVRQARGRAEIVVLVRPWAGGFELRHPMELTAFVKDVVAAREAGAAGVAAGVLTEDGQLDHQAMAALVEAARPLPVTLHRAIDAAANYLDTARAAARVGVRRILTSGGAASAWEGRDRIAELVRAVGSSIEVIAGAGLRSEHALALLEATGAAALHGSCSGASPSGPSDGTAEERLAHPALGMGTWQYMRVQEAAALVAAAHGFRGPERA